jgi:bacterioferritin (cytochrome b1)
MSEQYAFAIGFDDVESAEADKLPDVHWTSLYEQVATAIRESGLPPIDSERWDEFGQGRIFWGTKAECEAVKAVLAAFTIYVEEARNLESGYYTTPNHTYFVSDTGTIYVLPSNLASADGTLLETTDAIPLDSYRLKVVDPAMELWCHQHLQLPEHYESDPPIHPQTESPVTQESIQALRDQVETLSTELAALRAAKEDAEGLRHQIATLSTELTALNNDASAKVAPDVYATLEGQHHQQTVYVQELQDQLTGLEAQVSELQLLVSAKVDSQVHADLQYELAQQSERLQSLNERYTTELQDYQNSTVFQQQLNQQNERIVELERQLAQAEAQANEWKSTADQAISLESYTDLQQQFSAQTTQLQDLQQIAKHLDQQLRESSALAAQRVDPSRYNALEQDVTDKSALINDLRRTVQQLERAVSEWQTVAEAKVEWSEYQAVQDELKQFKMRRKKGLLGRLFG